MKHQIAEELTRQLTDAGRLVELGWKSYELFIVPRNASTAQLYETRQAFFAGAQHVFASIMTMLDPGEEPTDADLSRMSKIADELETFRREIELRVTPTKGSG